MPMFFKGLAFGFVLAAIVGPMWVLCFRRTLEHGAAAGLASGLGIALAVAAARVLRPRLSPSLLRGINMLSGAMILGFAGWQLVLLMR